MARTCKLSPVVFRREGTKIVEKDSKLFRDIKKAVVDYDTAWDMWAYSKTPNFKKKYPNVEYDELGEVTFPSLIKALGLEDSYNKTKDIQQVAKDYGFTGKVYTNPEEAVQDINSFNSKEERYIAYIEKDDSGENYTVRVVTRDATALQKAREQSYNSALTREIISLLNSLGFSVGFVNNPEYKGIFDPTQATLEDGLIRIINIARGVEGEEALPEEFAHAMIEGLINHPLVQRLLNSIDAEQLQDILGESYDKYFEKYNGDLFRLQKEAAGKLLAQHIQKKGTIRPSVVAQKRGLLSRIWNWVKEIFGKVSNDQIAATRNKAHNYISGVYDLITSDEGIALFDKHAVLDAEQMYLLREDVSTPELMAAKGMELSGRMIHSTRRKSASGKVSEKAGERFKEIADKFDADNYAESISSFLEDARINIKESVDELERWKDAVENAYTSKEQNVKDLKAVAGYVNTIQMLDEGYRDILTIIGTLDTEDNYRMFAIDNSPEELALAKEIGEYLADHANEYLKLLNTLAAAKQELQRRVLYMYSRTVFSKDIAIDVGKKKDQIMSLKLILQHADKDINFVERWLSALSDASDALLPIIDSLVKNQQYERDMEMIEWKKQISLADKKLRDAGYTSDFMYERDKDGVPTGRIISPYDFQGWNDAAKAKRNELREKYPDDEDEYKSQFRKWKFGATEATDNRLIKEYINPEYQKLYDEGKENEIPKDAICDDIPNPKVFNGKVAEFERLCPPNSPQREYYDTVMRIKKEMMTKIPRRGQGIYKVVYVSKDLIEGILDNSTGNPMKATFDYYKRNYTRRPDDIGFGNTEEFKEDIRGIIREEEDPKAAAEKILTHLSDSVDNDIFANIDPRKIERIIKDKHLEEQEKIKKIIGTISTGTFYEVDTDFANHKIQRLPIYYTRKLKNLKMLSTDFTGTLIAYSAMAVNYEKMNEIVDIIEVARNYSRERKVLEDGSSSYSMFQAYGKVFQGFVVKAGNGTNSPDRLSDYIDSVVYEQHKKDEGEYELFGVNLDKAKLADALKDYTGLLTLGLNLFSSVSNLTVGKIQQWIEAFGGENFNVKDYALAIKQYSANIAQCVAEMASPIKHNKLSLLIEMFDPMKDYYEGVRSSHTGTNLLSRILGNGALGYIGMGAGEHILRVQTMLACLNHIKLVNMDNPNEKISLYDALEVVTDKDGISRLELKPNLGYERDVIDTTGQTAISNGKFIAVNKNYGKPLKDENGKIVTELIRISEPESIRKEVGDFYKNAYKGVAARVHGEFSPEDFESDSHSSTFKTYMQGEMKQVRDNFNTFIQKRRKAMGKVNDSLNGAFSVPDKGAAHRRAVLRLVLQFRQWMPAHYSRRFAGAHYDGDLERWREGYYRTVGRIMNNIARDIRKGQWEYMKVRNSLSEHEKANLRRANAEIAMFATLFALVRVGGRVKDRDRSWLNRMALYQIHRMYLEVGASMPGNPAFIANIIQLMNSPMASINVFEKGRKLLKLGNAFEEIQTGRYQGWSEWQRDAFQMLPYMPQIWKAIDFDDSMFSMYERDN